MAQIHDPAGDAACMPHFPDLFQKLPEADVRFRGVNVRLLQGPTACAIFLEATEDVTVPEHSHGAQWGIVVEGEVSLTIGGETRLRRRGDEYSIPAGVPHAAVLRKGARVIDCFDDPNRYRPKA
jgi:quercetin dioxygenase-like cupin family protein